MFGMGNFEANSFDDLHQTQTKAEIKMNATFSVLQFGQGFIQGSGITIAMCIAAIAAAQGKLTPGDLVLIHSYIAQTVLSVDGTFLPFSRMTLSHCKISDLYSPSV